MRKYVAIGMAAMLAAAGGLFAVGTVEAGGGCHGEPAAPAPDVVSMEYCQFAPSVLHVDAGTEVTFTNNEGIAHSVTGAGWGNTIPLQEGDSIAFRFDDEGVYAYSCVLHPGMVGAVVVGDASGDGGSAVVKSAADEGGDGGSMPVWGIAAGAMLTGMVATGVAGLAIGRRKP